MWLTSDWQPYKQKHREHRSQICLWTYIQGFLTDLFSQPVKYIACHITLPRLRVRSPALSRTSHRATAWSHSQGHSFWWIVFFQFELPCIQRPTEYVSTYVCCHIKSKSWCRSKLQGISFLPVAFPSRSATHCQRSARKWHGDAGMRSLHLYIKSEAQWIWPAPLCVSMAKAGKETGEGGRLMSMWIEACVSVASQWGERLTDDGGADARQTMA